MAQSYLDKDGLTLLWSKIKTYIAKDGQDKVTNVVYDSANGKITKTINGITTDVISIETIKDAISLSIDLDGTVHM